jgi:penicillin G amidase
MDWLGSVRRDAACLRPSGRVFWLPPNGRITPDGYKYSISTEWEAPWRTDRIYRVLESGKKFAPADMLALQMDVSSAYDRLLRRQVCLCGRSRLESASERAKRAAEILRDWDGRMSADSAAPTIETKARQELVRMLLEPKLGPAADAGHLNSKSVNSKSVNSKSPSKADAQSGALSWKSYEWMMSSGLVGKCAHQATGALVAAGVLGLRKLY